MGQAPSCVGGSCVDIISVSEKNVDELSEILKELKKPGITFQQRQLLVLRSAKITEELHSAAEQNIMKATRNISKRNTNVKTRMNLMNAALSSLPGQPTRSNVDKSMDDMMAYVASRPTQVPASFRGGCGCKTRTRTRTRRNKSRNKSRRT